MREQTASLLGSQTDNYTIRTKTKQNGTDVKQSETTPVNSPPTEKTPEDNKPHKLKARKAPKTKLYDVRELSAALQLNKKDRMLYVPFQFHGNENFDNSAHALFKAPSLKPS